MTSTADRAVEHAIVTAALGVLRRRAAALHKTAADFTTSETDTKTGREIKIAAPEASVALGTARLLEDCAADIAEMLPGRRDGGPTAAGAPVGSPPRPPAPATAALIDPTHARVGTDG